MSKKNQAIEENTSGKKHIIGLIIGIILIIVAVIDYAHKKMIPNFIFMEEYSASCAEAYWTGVIGIGVSIVSILTFLHALDQFAFEKRVHRESKEQEKIKKFEESLKSAIEILDTKYENEIECLRAVQIIKNIIDYTIEGETANKRKKHQMDESEKYRIISIDGALVLLKQHLDKVLKGKSKSKRQDVRLAIEILYKNFYYKWNRGYLEELGIYNFENLQIDISYFDRTELSNMRFENVGFYKNGSDSLWILAGRNIFEKCTFGCDISVYVKEYANVEFSRCNLKGFVMHFERGKKYGIKGDSGTKSLVIDNSTIEGYFGMSRNSFDTLKLTNSIFKRGVHMQYVRVERELTIANSKFDGIVDMQSSVFCWRADFLNTECKEVFYIWDSDFFERGKVCFNNFYVSEFDKGNFNARVYTSYAEKKDESEVKTLRDCLEMEWNNEKHLFNVKEKLISAFDED